MHIYRSHTCGELRKSDVGESVRLSGWVHRVRDHGGVLFIDLRDHYGMTQVVADPDSPAFKAAEQVRSEWCIRIDGRVKARDDSLVNANLPTGEIELYADEISILGAAQELPLPVFGEPDYPEEIRMKHRYLDLRRETLHANMMLRSRIVRSLRNKMEDTGFTDFQTPILTASSPEGARDFLVPSRLHPGKFYALPQAPQIFKQLIMVSGFDRYYQIAPCFRDEDARADRSAGDFYQLDLEMSFVEQQDVFDAVGPVIRDTFEQFADGKPVSSYPFREIPYAEAMLKYGSDKPDLRNPLEMQVVTEHFVDSGFKIFAQIAADPQNEIRAIPAPGGGSRAFCDRMNSWAQKQGLPGMGYIMFDEGDGKGPLAKNIGPERTAAIREQLGLKAGDAAFFLAGKPAEFQDIAGKARNVVADELELANKDSFEFAWIVDFPMYEWDEENKKVEFGHNPFSMPAGGLEALEQAGDDPEKILAVKARQYDLVCNGYELGSGGIRNHKEEIMYKAFDLAGYGAEVVEEKFGGMLNAFRYGAPPHGGAAFGVDRIVMLLAGEQNIREVTMFPLNQQGEDLLLGAPVEASDQQLKDLHIRVSKPIEEKKG